MRYVGFHCFVVLTITLSILCIEMVRLKQNICLTNNQTRDQSLLESKKWIANLIHAIRGPIHAIRNWIHVPNSLSLNVLSPHIRKLFRQSFNNNKEVLIQLVKLHPNSIAYLKILTKNPIKYEIYYIIRLFNLFNFLLEFHNNSV